MLNVNAHFIDQLAVVSVMGLLLWAAVGDFRRFLIPNRLVLAVAALYPAHIMASASIVPWLFGTVAALVAFAVGAVLFAMKAMGGGDVKLFAATVLWATPEGIYTYFWVTLGVGFVLALAFAARAAFADAEVTSARGIAAAVVNLRYVPLLKLIVPYGVAISAGGLYATGSLLMGA